MAAGWRKAANSAAAARSGAAPECAFAHDWPVANVDAEIAAISADLSAKRGAANHADPATVLEPVDFDFDEQEAARV